MKWNAGPFVKSCLNCNHKLATDTRVEQYFPLDISHYHIRMPRLDLKDRG